MAVLLRSVTEWYCPNCGKRDVTSEARPHTRFHVCPKMRFLTAPLLRVGTAAKVELVERQDYVGSEKLPYLDPERGRPVQSIVTTRDNGQDAIAFAGAATARVEV